MIHACVCVCVAQASRKAMEAALSGGATWGMGGPDATEEDDPDAMGESTRVCVCVYVCVCVRVCVCVLGIQLADARTGAHGEDPHNFVCNVHPTCLCVCVCVCVCVCHR